MNNVKRYLIIGGSCLAIMGILLAIVVYNYHQSLVRTPEQQKADQIVAQKEALLQQKQVEDQKAQAVKDSADLLAWEKTPAGVLCAKHTDWQKDDCDKLIAHKDWIGMTYDMLVYQRGKPNVVSPSNDGSGNSYQYCWDNYTPSCFYDLNGDGILDSYN